MAKQAARKVLDVFQDPFHFEFGTSPLTTKLDEYHHMIPAWSEKSPLRSIESLREWVNKQLEDGQYEYGADIDDLFTLDKFLEFASDYIDANNSLEAYNIGLMIGMYLARYEAREKLKTVETGEKYSETQGENRRGKGTLSNKQWQTVLELRDSRLNDRPTRTYKSKIYNDLALEIYQGSIDGIPAGTELTPDAIRQKRFPK